ncbi:hypothetical protein [Terasakiella sp.]|uniref:hypothetical protein n=1 Tax=Terasakiella sp. TaxID=2034861 RepID=UPI003AA7CAE9
MTTLQEIKQYIAADDWKTVIRICEEKSQDESCDPVFIFLRAVGAFVEDDIAQACLIGEAAFAAMPDAKQVADFMAVISVFVGKSKDSYYYAKVRSVLEPNPEIEELLPQDILPDYSDVLEEIVEHPLLVRGAGAYRDGDFEKAENWFRQHIIVHPEHVQGHHALIDCLVLEERYRAAVEACRSALHILPENADLLSKEATLLAQLGYFEEAKSCHRQAKLLAPNDATIAAAMSMDLVDDPNVSVDEIRKDHQKWWDTFAFKKNDTFTKKADKEKRILNVGCILMGIDHFRFGASLAHALSYRDPSKYRTIGFGAGELHDRENMMYQKAFDDWRSVRFDDPHTLVESAKAFDIDVLINCSGLRQPEVLRTFGVRTAPVQILYAPAVLGARTETIDCQITNSIVVEDALRQTMETGHAIANIEQPDDMHSRAVPRSTGSPFTFGMDATFAELNCQTVEAIVRILRACPDSMVLLRNHDFERSENTIMLMEKFGNFGMAHRIDILATATFREFASEVDVFLMPARTQRFYIAVEAVSAGIPFVCNEKWDQVVGGIIDFAKSNNFYDEMVAKDEESYIELAKSWYNRADDLRQSREKMAHRLIEGNYYENAKRMNDLSQIIDGLWANAVEK